MNKENLKHNNLTPATLKDAQIEMLELLKIIDKICRENNIEYWIDCGTLLGAIRHKGFIPWDDDIDLCVPAIDYSKLLCILYKESSRNPHIFLYFYKNKNAQYWFDSLATTKIIMQSKKTFLACKIDIFPVKFIDPNDKKIDKDITDTACYFCYGGKSYPKNFYNKYIKRNLRTTLIEKKKFFNYFNNEYLPSCNKINSNSLLIYSFGNSHNDKQQYYLYTDVFPLQEIEFEGYKFFAPRDTHIHLTKNYGNYLNFPPKDEQLPKHSDHLYFSNSIKYSLNVTKQYLINCNRLFYSNFFKMYIKKNLIYEKLREFDSKRRAKKKKK